MSTVRKKPSGQGKKAGGDIDPVLAELVVKRLIEWREAVPLSQEEAASRVGMTTAWLSAIEKSINRTPKKPHPVARTPQLLAARLLCKLYGHTIEELVYRPGEDSASHSPASATR